MLPLEPAERALSPVSLRTMSFSCVSRPLNLLQKPSGVDVLILRSLLFPFCRLVAVNILSPSKSSLCLFLPVLISVGSTENSLFQHEKIALLTLLLVGTVSKLFPSTPVTQISKIFIQYKVQKQS